jgi:hypothetical protein
MIEQDDDALEARAASYEQWMPSSSLQRQLGVGAAAALLAGGLYAAGSILGFSDGPHDGFTAGKGLCFAAILPQFLVMLTFLALAREARSMELRRSCISTFVSSWVLETLSIGESTPFIPFLIPIAILGLATFTWPQLSRLFWMPVIITFLLFRARFFGNMQVSHWFLLSLTVFCSSCYAGFGIYFGKSLLQLRRRLGSWAAALGWTEIACALFGGGCLLWIMGIPLLAVLQVRNLPDTDMQALRTVDLCLALSETMFTALLFAFARKAVPADQQYFTDEYSIDRAEANRPVSVAETQALIEEDEEEEEEEAQTTVEPTGSPCPNCATSRPKGADFCRTCGLLFWDQIATGFGGSMILLGIGAAVWILLEGVGWKIAAGILIGLGVLAILALLSYLHQAGELRRVWREQHPFGD